MPDVKLRFRRNNFEFSKTKKSNDANIIALFSDQKKLVGTSRVELLTPTVSR